MYWIGFLLRRNISPPKIILDLDLPILLATTWPVFLHNLFNAQKAPTYTASIGERHMMFNRRLFHALSSTKACLLYFPLQQALPLAKDTTRIEICWSTRISWKCTRNSSELESQWKLPAPYQSTHPRTKLLMFPFSTLALLQSFSYLVTISSHSLSHFYFLVTSVSSLSRIFLFYLT